MNGTNSNHLEKCSIITKTWLDAGYNGSKAARVQVPKVYINGKFNIIMKKMLKTNVLCALCGD
jgi:hypothetical protein